MGLVDELVEEGKLREGAIAFAHKIAAEGRPLKRVRDSNDKVEAARGPSGDLREFPQGQRPQVPRLPGPGIQHPLHRGGGEPALRRGADDRAQAVRRGHDRPAVGGAALRLLRRAPGRQDPRRAGRHGDHPGEQGRHHRRRHHGRRHRHELRQRRHPGDHRRGEAGGAGPRPAGDPPQLRALAHAPGPRRPRSA